MSQVIQSRSAFLMLLILAQATAHAADESAASRPDAEPAPLSVAPLDQIQYPEDRPEWIDAPTNLKALPHGWTVVSGPSETSEQSLDELRLLPDFFQCNCDSTDIHNLCNLRNIYQADV